MQVPGSPVNCCMGFVTIAVCLSLALMFGLQATHLRNHSTVINFSTQVYQAFLKLPLYIIIIFHLSSFFFLSFFSLVVSSSPKPCWLYNSKDCSFPANPDQSDFGYVRGNALKVVSQLDALYAAADMLCCAGSLGQGPRIVLRAPAVVADEGRVHGRARRGPLERCVHSRQELSKLLFISFSVYFPGPKYWNMTYWEVFNEVKICPGR